MGRSNSIIDIIIITTGTIETERIEPFLVILLVMVQYDEYLSIDMWLL